MPGSDSRIDTPENIRPNGRMSDVYAGEQLDALLERISEVYDSASTEGCGEDLAVVDSTLLWGLHQEARRLRDMRQRLLIGRHEHRHGESTYLFLVPDGTEFGVDDLKANLQEDFDPEDGENLRVDLMDPPAVISPSGAASAG